MSRVIPPIGTRGVYSLTSPWTARGTITYTCAAIRDFNDIENTGNDVYETYYAPYDVERSVYEEDRRNNEVIVTLTSETEAPIYVPSSYIEAFPDLSYRNYHHVVLSASLGALPDYIDLGFVQDQVSAVISDTIGSSPEVHLSVAPLSGVVSPEQHEILETARLAAIENRTTDHARVLELQTQNGSLNQTLAVYESILRSNGLLPE